jgi:hypothetical protein
MTSSRSLWWRRWFHCCRFVGVARHPTRVGLGVKVSKMYVWPWPNREWVGLRTNRTSVDRRLTIDQLSGSHAR